MKKLCAWCGVKEEPFDGGQHSGGNCISYDVGIAGIPICASCILKALEKGIGEPKYLDECREHMNRSK